MPIFQVDDGETVTIPAGETETDGPINLNGTLNLDGTFNTAESTISGAAGLGLAGVGNLSGEKSVVGLAGLGATATGTVSGEKVVEASAGLGLTATGTLDSLVPLRRQNAFDIDNTRESDFTTQGTGNVDD